MTDRPASAVNEAIEAQVDRVLTRLKAENADYLAAAATVTPSEAMATVDAAKALRRTVARIERDLVTRDELIAQLHAAGMSNRAIAELAGLSHVGVAKVLARLEVGS